MTFETINRKPRATGSPREISFCDIRIASARCRSFHEERTSGSHRPSTEVITLAGLLAGLKKKRIKERKIKFYLLIDKCKRKSAKDAENVRVHGIVDESEVVPSTSTEIRRFADLAEQWRRETRLISNISKKALHPAYQQIIGMGEAAVPLILRGIEKNGPDDWFWALTSITGANPITESISGNIPAMTEAWLQWGRQAGYLADSRQKMKRSSRTSGQTTIT